MRPEVTMDAAAAGPAGLDRLRLVSLSHVNDPATTNVYPGDPPFEPATVTIADVEAFGRRHGRIPDGSMVIIWTGWEERRGTPALADAGGDGLLANLAALPPAGAHVLCGGAINRAGSGSTATVYGVIPPHH